MKNLSVTAVEKLSLKKKSAKFENHLLGSVESTPCAKNLSIGGLTLSTPAWTKTRGSRVREGAFRITRYVHVMSTYPSSLQIKSMTPNQTHLHVLEVAHDLSLRPHDQATFVGDELSLKPTVHAQEPGELELALHSEGLGHHRLWFLDKWRVDRARGGQQSHVGLLEWVTSQRKKKEFKMRGGDQKRYFSHN